MSEGIYLTPFKTTLQWVGTNLSDGAFKTFMMLFSHANDYGVCFPGYRLLAELGRHELTCIWEEMQEIMALDLVREIEPARRDRYGRWTPALYQVNPDFLYLREDNKVEALKLWLSSVEQNIEQKVPVRGLNSIVSIETAESALTNNSTNQHQQTTAAANSISSKTSTSLFTDGLVAKWQKGGKQEPRQEPNPDQREAHNNSAVRDTNNPPVPARPPTTYSELPDVYISLDGEAEQLAVRVRDETKIPLRTSRAVVEKFGVDRVRAALISDFVQTARKPGGALRHLLEKQNIEPDENLSSHPVERDLSQTIIK